MLIEGRVLVFGGDKDYQGDRFSKACEIHMPGSVQELPVVLATDTRKEIGKVVSMTVAEDGLYATVSIDSKYAEAIRIARAVTPLLGLCIMGRVQRTEEGVEDGVNTIKGTTPTGIMVGVNVDLTVGGFSYVNEFDRYDLFKEEEIPTEWPEDKAADCCREEPSVDEWKPEERQELGHYFFCFDKQ